MTRNEFTAICMANTIDPALAIENEAVRVAISQGEGVLTAVLNEEF